MLTMLQESDHFFTGTTSKKPFPALLPSLFSNRAARYVQSLRVPFIPPSPLKLFPKFKCTFLPSPLPALLPPGSTLFGITPRLNEEFKIFEGDAEVLDLGDMGSDEAEVHIALFESKRWAALFESKRWAALGNMLISQGRLHEKFSAKHHFHDFKMN